MLREGSFRPPSISFEGRLWPSEEMAGIAAGWLERVHAAIPRDARLTALPLPNRPDAIALFFTLSSLPLPVAVLPPDPRAWRTSPAIPATTPIFLPPSLADLAIAGEPLGLRTIVLPEARPASRLPRPLAFLSTPGMVNFTSGSTGLPKPVYILTRSFVLQTEAIVRACHLSEDSAVAASLPLATHYGLGQALLLPTMLGASLGLVERFDHRALLRLFASRVYTYWAGTPLMADMLARAPASQPTPPVPSICHISAGRLSVRVFRAFLERFGVPLRPNYGQTENGFITVDTSPPDEIRPDSVGRAAPGIEVRIGDDPLDPYPPGRLGRVWFTSPWYMEGYGFPPALSPREGRQGWWPTQDLGLLDDAGYLTLAGRADDCFKTSGGYLVNPGEIINALMSHAGVVDVVVLPVPDASGPVIGALVERDGSVDAEELRVIATRRLAPWLQPQIVCVTDRLPRLAGGKADRQACERILREAGSRPSVIPSSTSPRR
jgi:acyl-CoA synthetase (AMP-forming)/AMP-acid ligase II